MAEGMVTLEIAFTMMIIMGFIACQHYLLNRDYNFAELDNECNAKVGDNNYSRTSRKNIFSLLIVACNGMKW